VQPVIEIKNLSVSFTLPESIIYAVRNISLSMNKGETLGLVGESGCGKSVTAFSVLRLINPPGRIESGEIFYKGKNILLLPENEIMAVRGRHISMIFQEPMTSLNPVFTIGYQISSAVSLHLNIRKKEAKEMAVDLLNQVGIPVPSARYYAYPHELSGGMKQRVMIALALCAGPDVLIADEPTTALDTTIQSQILDLLLRIQSDRRTSLLLISHDLGIIANTADYVAVMYAGEIVEYARVSQIYGNPKHPYTKGLFESVLHTGAKRGKLNTIPGAVPAITKKPDSCVFYPRCSLKSRECTEREISLDKTDDEHFVRCIRL